MDGFIIFRKYFLLISQLIGATVCVFFIFNVQKYEISWNMLIWLLPSKVIEILNSMLSTIGTMVLTIPLTIIILSVLIPENLSLRIAGSFFGIASSLIILTSGILRDTISQSYNMRVFLVSKILSIEEKREIFKIEFVRIIDEFYKDNMELYNYLQEKLLDKYWIIYDTKLTMLKEPIAIKVSVGEIIHQFVEEYNNEKHILAVESLNIYLKYTLYAVGGLLVILGVCAIGRYFFGDNNVATVAGLVKDGAQLSLKGVENTKMTQEDTLALATEFIRLLPHIVTKNEYAKEREIFLNMIKDLFPNILERINYLEAFTLKLADHVKLPIEL